MNEIEQEQHPAYSLRGTNFTGCPNVVGAVEGRGGGQALRITVGGKGAHPIRSDEGVSAPEKALPILTALKELGRQNFRRPDSMSCDGAAHRTVQPGDLPPEAHLRAARGAPHCFRRDPRGSARCATGFADFRIDSPILLC